MVLDNNNDGGSTPPSQPMLLEYFYTYLPLPPAAEPIAGATPDLEGDGPTTGTGHPRTPRRYNKPNKGSIAVMVRCTDSAVGAVLVKIIRTNVSYQLALRVITELNRGRLQS